MSLCFAAAAIGALASIRAAEFYGQLTQPSWAPPASVFGPVWTVLYALMGVAAWLVWREGGFRPHRRAFALFAGQLGANAIWTWLFFGWRQGEWALADIMLLAVLVGATIVSFWRGAQTCGGVADSLFGLGPLRHRVERGAAEAEPAHDELTGSQEAIPNGQMARVGSPIRSTDEGRRRNCTERLLTTVTDFRALAKWNSRTFTRWARPTRAVPARG